MDTLGNMKQALDYIESNLSGEIEYTKIAEIALCSQYHFQRMFGFLIGIPLSEYIRRRRLTLAAFDLQNGNGKILDIALKYGYNSPDSFTRAFVAMHGILPSKAREKGVLLRAYPRITFSLSLKGVIEMNYRIEPKDPFAIVGIKQRLSHVDGLGESIGRMWSETPAETMEQIAGLGDGFILGSSFNKKATVRDVCPPRLSLFSYYESFTRSGHPKYRVTRQFCQLFVDDRLFRYSEGVILCFSRIIL